MSFAPHVIESARVPSEQGRREAWERGQPDYHGADQFDNIKAHIDSQLDQS